MERKSKLHEKFLYEVWKEKKFTRELSTKDGQKINIIDSGQENKELGGPDFKHARIRIGNITYNGDVEIDSSYADWKLHGHFLNKKYNKVILHAVFNNESQQSYVFTQEGRKVQSINIGEFVKDDLRTNIREAILKERVSRINKMPCIELNSILEPKEKLNVLFDLGIKRFNKKCSNFFDRLKEIAYLKELNLKEPVIKYELDQNFFNRKFTKRDFNDPEIWQQLFYESFFEALGYSKNKNEFKQLAHSADLKFLSAFCDKEDFLLYIEAALFHISGIIPSIHAFKDEDTAEYVKKLVETWNSMKSYYDGKIHSQSEWNFFKLRPQNFPTIRLAGGSRILYKIIRENLLGQIINTFKKFENKRKLSSELRDLFIVSGNGYWKNHYTFDQPAKQELRFFIGYSRADEIIINVALPAAAVYFDIFGEKQLSKRVHQHYLNYYHNNENQLVAEVASTLNLNDGWKRSVLYQGMIELFRTYCSKEKCLECEIGKKIFN